MNNMKVGPHFFEDDTHGNCKICEAGINHSIHVMNEAEKTGAKKRKKLLNPWKIEVISIYDTALDLRIINENTGEIKLLEGLTVDRINKLIEEDQV